MSFAKRSVGNVGGVIMVTLFLDSGHALAQCELHENAKLTASDAAQDDEFGVSVAVSGNVAAVGANQAAAVPQKPGSAYVFRRNGSSWMQEQKLVASDGAAKDEFGEYVSVSGDVAIVGAWIDDNTNGTDSGSAYVFRWNGSAWLEEQKLLASDGAAFDQFGIVSVSGDVVVVGAYKHVHSGIANGSAYVFRYHPEFLPGSRWVQEQELLPKDGEVSDAFGFSVAALGNVVLVGSIGADGMAAGSGAVYLYRGSGAAWALEQKLFPSDGETGEEFGRSVSISGTASGDVVVVGAWLDDDNGIQSGSAYVFRYHPEFAPGSRWVQEQKLLPSDGAAGEIFGDYVSVFDDTALVGALWDGGNGSGSGAAYVFHWNGSSWGQRWKLLPSDGAGSDDFGFVGVGDDVAIVGARFHDESATNSGAVYVFDLGFVDCNNNGMPDECDLTNCLGDPACGDCNNNGVPDGCEFDIVAEQIAKLTPLDAAEGDNFGVSVSVDGDTAVVGAHEDVDAGFQPGSAYVFHRIGSSWVEQPKLLATDGQAMDGFGYSVSVSGDIAVVGAPNDDDNGSASGSAYVFRRNGLVWVQEQKLLASDGAAVDWFGAAVSVSGDLAVVGAPFDDDNGTASGSAYVFRYHPELLPAAPWVEEATLRPLDAAAGDYFGWTVCVLGDVVLVGARYGDGNETDSGTAYVFRWNGSLWVQEQELVASDGAENDEFGISVSVSVSEDTVVVGAWHNNDAGLHSGSAYVFTRSGTTWIEQQKLTASDAAAIDYFGVSVSVSSNMAIVGAHFDGDNGNASGSAYVFRYHPELLIGNRWVEEQKLLASDGAVFDNFGVSVSVSGDVGVVGSRFDDDSGSDSGSVYVFEIGMVDCNNNGIPDECDIANCPPNTPICSDCNYNGIPDECDIANCPNEPACQDCNGNGLPDGCELSVTELVKLAPAGIGATDHFGISVSNSEQVLVVGSAGDDCNAGTFCGSAYVFAGGGSTWTQLQKLLASDADAENYFGFSVSVGDDAIVVGAYGDDCLAGLGCGSAYIFRHKESGWVEEQKLSPDDADANDSFGYAVALDGDVAVVGAFFDRCPAGFAGGSAYVFRYNGFMWVQAQKLTAPGCTASDYFGYSLAVKSNVMVVGAPLDDCAVGSDCGAVYVFRYDGFGWVPEQKIVAADASADDFFGSAVAISGDVVVIGADYSDCGVGDNCGSVYVFRHNRSTWVQEQKLAAFDALGDDRFGGSVCVDSDTVVVGAFRDDCAVGLECGSAYVFQYDGAKWTEGKKFTASDIGPFDYFGSAVSIAGHVIVVGADYNECPAGDDCGSAYIYTLADCNNNGIPDECDIADCLPSEPYCQDCNGDGVPDGCEVPCGDGLCTLVCGENECTCPGDCVVQACAVDADCDDFDACTCDFCVCNACMHQPREFGDTDCNCLATDVDDILCVLDCFSLGVPACPGADIAPPCTGDGLCDVDDILAVLDAFSGINHCFTCGTSCPLGACCDGLECRVTTAALCLLAGDVYKGDGSACPPLGPDPCP